MIVVDCLSRVLERVLPDVERGALIATIGLSARERKIVRAKLSQFQITVRNLWKQDSNPDEISQWKTYRTSVKISDISELDFDLILRRFWEGFWGYLGSFSALKTVKKDIKIVITYQKGSFLGVFGEL